MGKLLSACKFDAQEKTIEIEAAWPVPEGRRALAWISDSIMMSKKPLPWRSNTDRAELLKNADAHFLKEEFKEADEPWGGRKTWSLVIIRSRQAQPVKASLERKEKFDVCMKDFDKAVTTRDHGSAQGALARRGPCGETTEGYPILKSD